MSDLVAVALSIACVSGVVATVFFAVAWLRTSTARGWTSTTGVVVNRRSGTTEGGIPANYPTFQWQDPTGRTFTHTSSMKQSLGPAPGTRVPVLYDPRDPSRAVIDSFVQSGRLFWLLGGLALAFGVLIGGFLLLGAARMS